MTPQQLLMLQMMGQPQQGTPPPWMAGAPAGMGSTPQINPLLMNALISQHMGGMGQGMGQGMDPSLTAMMMTPQQQGQGVNPVLWAMMMQRFNPQAGMFAGVGR